MCYFNVSNVIGIEELKIYVFITSRHTRHTTKKNKQIAQAKAAAAPANTYITVQ